MNGERRSAPVGPLHRLYADRGARSHEAPVEIESAGTWVEHRPEIGRVYDAENGYAWILPEEKEDSAATLRVAKVENLDEPVAELTLPRGSQVTTHARTEEAPTNGPAPIWLQFVTGFPRERKYFVQRAWLQDATIRLAEMPSDQVLRGDVGNGCAVVGSGDVRQIVCVDSAPVPLKRPPAWESGPPRARGPRDKKTWNGPWAAFCPGGTGYWLYEDWRRVEKDPRTGRERERYGTRLAVVTEAGEAPVVVDSEILAISSGRWHVFAVNSQCDAFVYSDETLLAVDKQGEVLHQLQYESALLTDSKLSGVWLSHFKTRDAASGGTRLLTLSNGKFVDRMVSDSDLGPLVGRTAQSSAFTWIAPSHWDTNRQDVFQVESRSARLVGRWSLDSAHDLSKATTTADGKVAWFSRGEMNGVAVFDGEVQGRPRWTAEHLQALGPVSEIVLDTSGRRAILTTERGHFRVDSRAESTPFAMSIGGVQVKSGDTLPLTTDLRDQDLLKVAVGAARSPKEKPKSTLEQASPGRLTLELVDDENSVLARAQSVIKERGVSVPLRLEWVSGRELAWGHPNEFRFHVQDAIGTDVTLTVKNVHFLRPLKRLVSDRGLAVGLVFLLLIAGIRLSLGNLAFSRWLPSIASACAGGWAASASMVPFLPMPEDRAGFLIAIGSASVALIVGSPFSPGVFRAVAPVVPFNLAAPVLLGIPWARRRLFAPYARATIKAITQSSDAELNEIYMPLHAMVEDGESSRATPRPETEVLSALRQESADGATIIVIEGRGGIGKTSLLRHVVRTRLADFLKNGRGPLPVMLSSLEGSLVDNLRIALGMHDFIPEMLASQVARGDFLVVVDGLSEMPVGATTLESIRVSAEGRAPMLVTTRENASLKRILTIPTRTRCIRPLLPKQREALALKVAYCRRLEELAVERGTAPPLNPSDDDLAACKVDGDRFSPLLIRLALQYPAGGGPVRLYHNALERLLKGSSVTLDQAATLAGKYYVRRREPRIPAWTNKDANERGLVESLLRAGVVSAVYPNTSGVQRDALELPDRVKFVHDSFVVFLGALSIRAEDGWSSLFDAAADPKFSDEPGAGLSELYVLCCKVFPRDELVQVVLKQLDAWRIEYRSALSRDDVLICLDDEVRERVAPQVPLDHGGGAALSAALLELTGDAERTLSFYGKLARKVWPVRESRELH